MKITSLTLKDFRGFENVELHLDRPLTVLAGVNGAGKTSVLDAIVYVLSEALRYFAYGAEWDLLRLRLEDIRIGAEGAHLHAWMSHEGKQAEWIVERPRDPRQWVVPHSMEEFKWRNTRFMLAAVYAATRSVAQSENAFGAVEGVVNHPYDELFRDWLSAPRAGFHSFFRWFKGREDVENELKVAREDLTFQDPQLAAVRRAVTSIVPGFTALRVQRDPLHLVVRKDGIALYLDQLSEGERNLIVMVADLARRLAVANADLSDPLTGEALVLIDEIELHLHPSWQRTVLGALLRTFPNCQFIVTTHSPQVLSEVSNDAVVLVKDFACYHPAVPTEGRDSNAILWEVLGVTARPAVVTAELDAIGSLLDARRYDEAQAHLDRIAEMLTERDPEVQSLRGILDVVERLDASAPQEPAE